MFNQNHTKSSAQFDLELEQLDVKTAFLHVDLEETIYMDQPEGVIKPGTKNLVCLLKKSFYGLRQSLRQWYKRFDEFMLGIKFIRCSYDSCVYLKMKNDQVAVYLLLYIRRWHAYSSKSMQDIQELKQKLNSEFEMKDLGEEKRILGMEMVRDRKNRKLFLTQSSYLKKVVQKLTCINQTRS